MNEVFARFPTKTGQVDLERPVSMSQHREPLVHLWTTDSDDKQRQLGQFTQGCVQNRHTHLIPPLKVIEQDQNRGLRALCRQPVQEGAMDLITHDLGIVMRTLKERVVIRRERQVA